VAEIELADGCFVSPHDTLRKEAIYSTQSITTGEVLHAAITFPINTGTINLTV